LENSGQNPTEEFIEGIRRRILGPADEALLAIAAAQRLAKFSPTREHCVERTSTVHG
jgi:hypothetical protein